MATTRFLLLGLLVGLSACTAVGPLSDAAVDEPASNVRTVRVGAAESASAAPVGAALPVEPPEPASDVESVSLDPGTDGHTRTESRVRAVTQCKRAFGKASKRLARGRCGRTGSNECALDHSALRSVYETCVQSASIYAVGQCASHGPTSKCSGPVEGIDEGGAAQLFDRSAGRAPVATGSADQVATGQASSYRLRYRSGSTRKRAGTVAVFADSQVSVVGLDAIPEAYRPPLASTVGCEESASLAVVAREPYLNPGDEGDDGEVPLAVWIRCDGEDRLFRHTGFDAWNVGSPSIRWIAPESARWKADPKARTTYNAMATDAYARVEHLQACTSDAECGSVVVGKCPDCKNGAEIPVRVDSIDEARRLLPPSRYADLPDCPKIKRAQACGATPNCNNRRCTLAVVD